MYRGQTSYTKPVYCTGVQRNVQWTDITSEKNVQRIDIIHKNQFTVQLFIKPVYSTVYMYRDGL